MGDIKKFVGSIALLDVFLKAQNGACHVLPRTIDPSKINLSFDFKAGFEKLEKDKIVLVIVSLKVVGTDKETNELRFDAFSEYVLAYEYHNYDGSVTEKLLKDFSGTTGVFNAYPYLREAIQTMTTKMGIPPVVAPLLKIEPPKIKVETPVEEDKIVQKKKSKVSKKK